ncbi:MAG: tripartite tricarboxylate transporter TctB family protein [Deltaproteobacteria bacterium]|nr:tripartite tricarboxylate transporter TctB family protein [Deltaproteobacteria bacterium]
MQRAEIGCAIALLLLSGVTAWEAMRLDIGWGDIGPKGGFFPFWLAVLLAVSSLSVIIKALLSAKNQSLKPFLTRKQALSVLTVLLPMALVVPMVETVGFYLTSFLYLSFYIWWTGRQVWFVTLAVSLLFPIIIFLIFEKWFLLPLPKGLLEPYVPF